MSVLAVQATIQRDTALPEDEIVNTWHFSTGSTPATEAHMAEIATALTTFYGDVTDYYADVVTGAPHFTFYDLDDVIPRVPVYEDDGATMTPLTTALPEEVAVVMSFQAEPASGLQQARRRNRIFLGPLGVATVTITSGRVRLAGAFRSTIVDAAQALLDASDASANWAWQTYSPTNRGGGAAAAGIALVHDGWVDDAFDTQRRRGAAPTSRATFTL